MSKLTRTLAAAVTAGALTFAAPAMASDTVIIDGQTRPAEALTALKGKVNIVQAGADRATVAFTKKADAKAYLRTLGVNADKKPRVMAKSRAKAAWYGDYADFYEHHNGLGWRDRIDSGYGVSDFHHVGFLGLWNHGDQISSVRTVGRGVMLYSETGYRGTLYYVGPNQHHDLPWSFNDRTSSAWVYW